MRPLLFAFLLSPFAAFAQFGVSYQYQLYQVDDWNTVLGEALDVPAGGFLPTGHRYELDYWIKALPDYRLELMPALSYAEANYQFEGTTWRLRTIGVQLNTNIYPFDWEGDCDCPVWSKSEPVFKKGFFLQLSPGLRQVRTDRQTRDGGGTGGPVAADASALVPHLGVGAGLDIGLSDLLTLSPLVRYVHAFSVEWPQLIDGPSAEPYTGTLGQWEIGLRVGVRLDQ